MQKQNTPLVYKQDYLLPPSGFGDDKPNKIKPLELGTKSMLFRDKVQNHGWLAKISSVLRDAGEPRVCHNRVK